jgi:hypothetical protein
MWMPLKKRNTVARSTQSGVKKDAFVCVSKDFTDFMQHHRDVLESPTHDCT